MSMDIEDLNKSQIILLTLLVSFMTSIATGIVTVSLMEKAPKDVVRITQRVVERVVEKVKDANPVRDKKEPVKEKIIEKTVVVKEGDLIAQAIAENRDKIMTIHEEGKEDALAFAFPVSEKYIITDAYAIKPGIKYVLNKNGENINLKMVKKAGVRELALFEIKDTNLSLSPIKISDSTIRLGQSIFTFSDFTAQTVKQGIVSNVSEAGVLHTELSLKNPLPATAVFNSSGELLGLSTGASRKIGNLVFVGAPAVSVFVNTPVPNNNNQESSNTDDSKASSTNELSQTDEISSTTSQTAAAANQ